MNDIAKTADRISRWGQYAVPGSCGYCMSGHLGVGYYQRLLLNAKGQCLEEPLRLLIGALRERGWPNARLWFSPRRSGVVYMYMRLT